MDLLFFFLVLMPHFVPSTSDSYDESCFDVEEGLELEGDWAAVIGSRPGTRMSGFL